MSDQQRRSIVIVTETRPVEILMVDDDPLDIELFERTLRKERIANTLHTAGNGIEALEFMRARQADAGPLVMLLDINMPKMNGLECLQAIRDDDELKSTVVFILTTSDNERDIYDAYNLNVAGYLVKGELGAGFLEGVKMLDGYWRLVELPEGAP